jgi:hypothetical protein
MHHHALDAVQNCRTELSQRLTLPAVELVGASVGNLADEPIAFRTIASTDGARHLRIFENFESEGSDVVAEIGRPQSAG